MRNSQKFLATVSECCHGVGECLQQYDVAIHVAEQRRGGGLTGAAKNVVQQGSSGAILGDILEAMEIQLCCDFGGAFFFAAEENFGTGREAGPTLNGVALNHA